MNKQALIKKIKEKLSSEEMVISFEDLPKEIQISFKKIIFEKDIKKVLFTPTHSFYANINVFVSKASISPNKTPDNIFFIKPAGNEIVIRMADRDIEEEIFNKIIDKYKKQ